MTAILLRLFFFSNMLLASAFLSCCNKSNKKESKIILTDYYEDGRVKSIFEMTPDSILNGKSDSYYRSGNILSTIYFKDDKPEGEMITYYESGKIRSVINYLNGSQNGKSIFYYENGNKETQSNYYNGIEVGHQYTYFNNNENTIQYDDFIYLLGDKRKVNTSIEYDESGKIIKRTPYLEFTNNSSSIDIILKEGKWMNMRAIIGDYDYLFNHKAESSIDTIVVEDFRMTLPYSSGDTIRGYIEYWNQIDTHNDVIQIIHFSYPCKWENWSQRTETETGSAEK